MHFGTSTPAIATVVATFMAGFGLGTAVFGARADRSQAPFRLYRRLELGIAVSGACVSLFVLRGGRALDGLARVCEYAGPWSGVVRALLFAALMSVPATLMGGTLPVLARALERRGHSGSALSLLYACNTTGAIFGALLPDFLLIPQCGLTISACVAVSGNASVAFGVWRLEATGRLLGREVQSDPPSSEPEWTPRSTQRSIAALLAASSGFAAMGLELLWSRTLQHWTAALSTSFAVLLALNLAMLALGTVATRGLAQRTFSPLAAASLLLGATGVTSLASIASAYAWRDLERAWWPRAPEMRRLSLWADAVDALLHASYLEALPCLCMGAAFPFMAVAFLREGRAGARTGQLLAINTIAGVLGALVMAFACLPALGQQGSYVAVALLLGAVALMCGIASAATWPARLTAAVAPVVALALALGLPHDSLWRAHFRTGSRLVAVREGSTTTAAAALRLAYGQPYYAELLTPGVSMSSTAPQARRYMSMMAHAALFSARASKRALLICYGVGNTASALLSHRALERLDVVDISREVLSLAPIFARALGVNPLADPRVHVFVDDGRHHLIVHDAAYDVITAEPPPPNHAGVVNLYSREFYRLAASRLAPGGVITQWLPVFELSNAEARAMIAAFVAELPHTALLYGYKEHLILLGSKQPLAVDLGRAETAAQEPALAHNLTRSGIGELADVLGSVVATDAELRREAQGAAPVTDDLPSLQYPSENVRADTSFTASLPLTAAHAFALLAPEASARLRANVADAARATRAVISVLPLLQPGVAAEWTELGLGRAMQAALHVRPTNSGLWSVLGLDPDHVRAAEVAVKSAQGSQLVAAEWTLARRAFYAGAAERALDLLERIHPEPDEVAQHALLRAGALRMLGRTQDAKVAFQRAADASRDERFKAAAQALAADVEAPFIAERGPWSAGLLESP